MSSVTRYTSSEDESSLIESPRPPTVGQAKQPADEPSTLGKSVQAMGIDFASESDDETLEVGSDWDDWDVELDAAGADEAEQAVKIAAKQKEETLSSTSDDGEADDDDDNTTEDEDDEFQLAPDLETDSDNSTISIGEDGAQIIEGLLPKFLRSIAYRVKKEPRLSKLNSVLPDAIRQSLSKNLGGKLTLFAPINSAFGEGQPGPVPQEVLLNHVVVGSLFANDIINAGVTVLQTLGGGRLRISVSFKGVVEVSVLDSTGSAVTTANVVKADLRANNGVVHLIDAVLIPAKAKPKPVPGSLKSRGPICGQPVHEAEFDAATAVVCNSCQGIGCSVCGGRKKKPRPAPKSVSIAVKLESAGNFTLLLTALKAAGLAQTLDTSGPFTVFAPTDAAFNKLPTATVQFLLAEENRQQLADILKYHVISGKALSKDLAGKVTEAPTLLVGKSVRVDATADTIKVNGDATVTSADVMASNGVVHVIDTVLTVPTESANEQLASALRSVKALSGKKAPAVSVRVGKKAKRFPKVKLVFADSACIADGIVFPVQELADSYREVRAALAPHFHNADSPAHFVEANRSAQDFIREVALFRDSRHAETEMFASAPDSPAEAAAHLHTLTHVFQTARFPFSPFLENQQSTPLALDETGRLRQPVRSSCGGGTGPAARGLSMADLWKQRQQALARYMVARVRGLPEMETRAFQDLDLIGANVVDYLAAAKIVDSCDGAKQQALGESLREADQLAIATFNRKAQGRDPVILPDVQLFYANRNGGFIEAGACSDDNLEAAKCANADELIELLTAMYGSRDVAEAEWAKLLAGEKRMGDTLVATGESDEWNEAYEQAVYDAYKSGELVDLRVQRVTNTVIDLYDPALYPEDLIPSPVECDDYDEDDDDDDYCRPAPARCPSPQPKRYVCKQVKVIQTPTVMVTPCNKQPQCIGANFQIAAAASQGPVAESLADDFPSTGIALLSAERGDEPFDTDPTYLAYVCSAEEYKAFLESDLYKLYDENYTIRAQLFSGCCQSGELIIVSTLAKNDTAPSLMLYNSETAARKSVPGLLKRNKYIDEQGTRYLLQRVKRAQVQIGRQVLSMAAPVRIGVKDDNEGLRPGQLAGPGKAEQQASAIKQAQQLIREWATVGGFITALVNDVEPERRSITASASNLQRIAGDLRRLQETKTATKQDKDAYKELRKAAIEQYENGKMQLKTLVGKLSGSVGGLTKKLDDMQLVGSTADTDKLKSNALFTSTEVSFMAQRLLTAAASFVRPLEDIGEEYSKRAQTVRYLSQIVSPRVGQLDFDEIFATAVNARKDLKHIVDRLVGFSKNTDKRLSDIAQLTKKAAIKLDKKSAKKKEEEKKRREELRKDLRTIVELLSQSEFGLDIGQQSCPPGYIAVFYDREIGYFSGFSTNCLIDGQYGLVTYRGDKPSGRAFLIVADEYISQGKITAPMRPTVVYAASTMEQAQNALREKTLSDPSFEFVSGLRVKIKSDQRRQAYSIVLVPEVFSADSMGAQSVGAVFGPSPASDSFDYLPLRDAFRQYVEESRRVTDRSKRQKIAEAIGAGAIAQLIKGNADNVHLLSTICTAMLRDLFLGLEQDSCVTPESLRLLEEIQAFFEVAGQTVVPDKRPAQKDLDRSLQAMMRLAAAAEQKMAKKQPVPREAKSRDAKSLQSALVEEVFAGPWANAESGKFVYANRAANLYLADVVRYPLHLFDALKGILLAVARSVPLLDPVEGNFIVAEWDTAALFTAAKMGRLPSSREVAGKKKDKKDKVAVKKAKKAPQQQQQEQQQQQQQQEQQQQQQPAPQQNPPQTQTEVEGAPGTGPGQQTINSSIDEIEDIFRSAIAANQK